MNKPASLRARGFTLVEMMVSLALLTLITLVMLTITNQTSRIWNYTSSRSEQFNNASLAFQTITQRLSQATLNTFWDYDNQTKPTKYIRQSELRFLVKKASDVVLTDSNDPTAVAGSGQAVFFQAPLGVADDSARYGQLPNLLNTWGYYTIFGKEQRPSPIESLGPLAPPQRYRYRLMELMDPSDYLAIYDPPSLVGYKWFQNAMTRNSDGKDKNSVRPVHVLAENVIALVLLPQLSQLDADAYLKNSASSGAGSGKVDASVSPTFEYDSTSTSAKGAYPWLNQLPPVVQVTMIAIDEPSAKRLASRQGASSTSQPKQLQSLLSGRFSSASDLSRDLSDIKDGLSNRNQVSGNLSINYRVFTSNVSLRGARWSPK